MRFISEMFPEFEDNILVIAIMNGLITYIILLIIQKIILTIFGGVL